VALLIVFYAAMFPMVLNTWSGVRSVPALAARPAPWARTNPAVLEVFCPALRLSSLPRCGLGFLALGSP
jgi:ABC-type nitrate/sulfonate/bicarbonate transport system permease component